MDTLTPKERSQRMALIRSKDTRPEVRVRSLVHRMGYRFRLHGRGLPGSPDLVLPSRNCVIFVHGCFWHRHDCSAGRRVPKSRQDFWLRKFEQNVRRDRRVQARLRRLGWRVAVVWECQLKQPERLARRLDRFIGG